MTHKQFIEKHRLKPGSFVKIIRPKEDKTTWYSDMERMIEKVYPILSVNRSSFFIGGWHFSHTYIQVIPQLIKITHSKIKL